MKSFNEQMAAYETIQELTDDVMITLWQAMSIHCIETLRGNQNECDWHADACDFVPEILHQTAMLFGHTTEGPVCTLEQLRIHVCHPGMGVDTFPWDVLGRLFDDYDAMDACYKANEHRYPDVWSNDPNPYHIDMKALPAD